MDDAYKNDSKGQTLENIKSVVLTLGQLFEYLLHVVSGLGTRAEVLETHLLGIVLGRTELHDPSRLHVALVTYDDYGEFGAHLLSQLLDPL